MASDAREFQAHALFAESLDRLEKKYAERLRAHVLAVKEGTAEEDLPASPMEEMKQEAMALLLLMERLHIDAAQQAVSCGNAKDRQAALDWAADAGCLHQLAVGLHEIKMP